VRKPRPLVRGSVVRLVAPCGPVPADRFATGVQVLAGFGLVPRWDPRLFASDGFLAGPDDERAAELLAAFTADDADGVIAARGGYGVMRVLPALEARAADLRPRLFQGFSDLTALHLFFLGAGDLVTFHGPNVTTLAQADPESLRRTRNALMGLDREATFRWDGLQTVTGGRAQGRLVAGNLTMLGAMMGTRHAPPLRGAILVVEDVNEPVYRLDRLLTQVALAADAAGIAGVVIGELGARPEDTDALVATIRRFARILGRPVVTGFPAGHGTLLHPVPEGVQAVVDADSGVLQVVEDPYAS
jgi:muramoyltetrapeptide carboxypeptidase